MNSIFYELIGILLPFMLTTVGSALVFCLRTDINKKVSAIINGFSAGIMMSACIWSMIMPSFNYIGEDFSHLKFLPAIVGIILGCLFVLCADVLLKKFNSEKTNDACFNKKLNRFLIAFTIHNIPEGLAVGFAIGGAVLCNVNSALAGAMGLAIGIAIQNLPEGLAVSLPIYKSTNNKLKSFGVGVLSGAIEPIFAIIGLFLATKIQFLMPWLLCFSAGCMLFVSVEDLLPESQLENSHIGTWAFVVGFLIMMTLDIVLG
ncbi:MAG: ZIP family metal transporter [Christensenellales bacterium]